MSLRQTHVVSHQDSHFQEFLAALRRSPRTRAGRAVGTCALHLGGATPAWPCGSRPRPGILFIVRAGHSSMHVRSLGMQGVTAGYVSGYGMLMGRHALLAGLTQAGEAEQLVLREPKGSNAKFSVTKWGADKKESAVAYFVKVLDVWYDVLCGPNGVDAARRPARTALTLYRTLSTASRTPLPSLYPPTRLQHGFLGYARYSTCPAPLLRWHYSCPPPFQRGACRTPPGRGVDTDTPLPPRAHVRSRSFAHATAQRMPIDFRLALLRCRRPWAAPRR